MTFGVPTTAVAELPPELRISVVIATVNGSGCPVNTASASILDDGKKVGVKYSDFMVSSNGPIMENCQLSMRLFTPNGYVLGVQNVTVTGYNSIAAGATGVMVLTYYLQGEEESRTKTYTSVGPRSGYWTIRDTSNTALYTAEPCGRVVSLNINTRLVIDPGTSTSTSLMKVSSGSAEYSTLLSLTFTPCT
jgi:hypothetical protein